MKVLYVNGADIEGGAARAATRLLHGIHDQGIEARLHVQRKYGADPLIDGPRNFIGKAMGRVRPTIEQLACGIDTARTNGPFCASFLPDRLSVQVAKASPNIVHLHWVARMMRLETLARFKVPIVWTMHDSWAFTGGCYLPGDCTRYRESCGKCPVLNSAEENDLSQRIWLRKKRAWQVLNLTLVAPSRWMADCARSSSLFQAARIEVIPNGVDMHSYKPYDKQMARERFSLPHDKKLILFGAIGATSDRNKGFHLLTAALRKLAATTQPDTIDLVVFGTAESNKLSELGLKTHYLGWLSDDTGLAQLYSAADVCVLPSVQENLPYTVMEAMACGTPCVAFNQGGVPDLIAHEQNGFLAQPYAPDDLARGIAWVLEDTARWIDLSNHAWHKVEREFSVEMVAERHIALYKEILNQGFSRGISGHKKLTLKSKHSHGGARKIWPA